MTHGSKVRCSISADAKNGMAALASPRVKDGRAAFPRALVSGKGRRPARQNSDES